MARSFTDGMFICYIWITYLLQMSIHKVLSICLIFVQFNKKKYAAKGDQTVKFALIRLLFS